ncbi:7-carboxy-7-deazaguanine synthase QueE [Halofilum ochraceum]|uniref:7-carboxy-7-deazaguanine synthase QueE n=1 Tax=Halofilum ochraceum TaxID=1611323 RepID=UPI00082D5234|nr:7-carboxy-7-deazaguanine synthase QueE [Halofilum ochraceum]
MEASAAVRDLPATERVRITEIFRSLQGEGATTGAPTVFVRLTGCPLRCVYCDTAYAFHGGESHSVDDVLGTVAELGSHHVCVTGGEPLAQPGCLSLLTRLCDAGHEVSLETSGALDISGVDRRVSRVLDLKTPGSGECERNLWENIGQLTARDQIKFVLCDRNDFEWAVDQIHQRRLGGICTIWFSPVWESLSPRDLADWIAAEQPPVRMQLQLHKIIWGDEPGR